MIHTGQHFLQIPGLTSVRDRILRAMDRPVMDHRGLEFAGLAADPDRLGFAGTLSGGEMGLRFSGVPHRPGGVLAA